LSEVGSTECKMSEVAALAPTYEYGYVGFVCGFVFHSDSIITRVVEGWKGDVGFRTICFMYVSCSFQFSVFGIVWTRIYQINGMNAFWHSPGFQD